MLGDHWQLVPGVHGAPVMFVLGLSPGIGMSGRALVRYSNYLGMRD